MYLGVRYSCEQCPYTAASRSGLSSHVALKHEGIRYPCDKCDYEASQMSNLKKHVNSKHNGNTYPCNQCNYVTSYPHNLKQHIKSKVLIQPIERLTNRMTVRSKSKFNFCLSVFDSTGLNFGLTSRMFNYIIL